MKINEYSGAAIAAKDLQRIYDDEDWYLVTLTQVIYISADSN